MKQLAYAPLLLLTVLVTVLLTVLLTVGLARGAPVAEQTLAVRPVAATTTDGGRSDEQPARSAWTDQRDQTLVRQIEDSLHADSDLRGEPVMVKARRGRVALSGWVASPALKERAGQIARGMLGVRSVRNLLAVAERPPSDARLEAAVGAALRRHASPSSTPIHAVVQDGVVRLRGQAQTWREALLASTTAAAVPGVRTVHNGLDIAEPAPAAEEIQNTVDQRIASDQGLAGARIEMQVSQTGVILGGSVATESQRQRAIRDTWAPGVRMVDAARLLVQPAQSSASLASARTTDPDLRWAVGQALEPIAELRVFGLGVSVSQGVVTLTGMAASPEARDDATARARAVDGVVDVRNQMAISLAGVRGNGMLTRAVRQALDLIPRGHEAGVKVVGQTAYLFGQVDTEQAKLEAQAVAAKVPGITAVENQLRSVS